jgi:hypothetical protein
LDFRDRLWLYRIERRENARPRRSLQCWRAPNLLPHPAPISFPYSFTPSLDAAFAVTERAVKFAEAMNRLIALLRANGDELYLDQGCGGTLQPGRRYHVVIGLGMADIAAIAGAVLLR